MRTFLCGKAPLPHNKRNCYPPYPDHYLNLARITKFKFERETKRIMVVVVKWSHRAIFFLSLVTVPEAFAKVNSRQFVSRFQSGEFLVCNHVTWRPCWGSINGCIFSWRIYMKMEFSSQRRKKLLFLTTNMAAVTSRANQQYTEIYLHKFCNRVIQGNTESLIFLKLWLFNTSNSYQHTSWLVFPSS